jgi:hypothetical protein
MKLCERKKVRGLWVEKKIEEGVMGKNMGGGAQGRPDRGGRRTSRARRRPGGRGTERGGRGQLIPVLTSGWDGLWREIDGRRRSAVEAALVAAAESSEEGERRPGRCVAEQRAA